MSPRMHSDGSVRIVNIGTPENPHVKVVPDTPPSHPLDDVTKPLAQTIQEAGMSMEAFIEAWLEAGGNLIGDPKEELKWRLNQQVQMIDPGEPINWRGERGLRGL